MANKGYSTQTEIYFLTFVLYFSRVLTPFQLYVKNTPYFITSSSPALELMASPAAGYFNYPIS